MSNPHMHSEMAHWLQDNLADYLWNADREELAEFVEKMMPHISNIGVRVIYPLVSEVYPPRSTPTYGMVATARDPMPTTMEELADYDDDLPINYGGTK
jgi:hypothetical protein